MKKDKNDDIIYMMMGTMIGILISFAITNNLKIFYAVALTGFVVLIIRHYKK